MRDQMKTRPARADARLVRLRGLIAMVSGAALLASSAIGAGGAPPDWEKTITRLPRGDFPNPRPLEADYKFGWSGFVAATAELHLGNGGEQLSIDAHGGTIGLVRALWKLDARHQAVSDAGTLRPISMHQVEERRHKTQVTDLVFKPGRVERLRTDTSSHKKAERKTYKFSGAFFDMFSALLYLRSQPLREGDVYRVLVYPATNPYLVTLTVAGREPIRVEAGEYRAIKLNVQIKKIGKHNELEPHKKFRHASVWVSDDKDRLLLRIEASIFVGSVFAELQSVQFRD